jgi:hypothetical protein
LKISWLFHSLKEAFGERGVMGGGYILTVAPCQSECAEKLALGLDFGAR